MLLVMDFVHLGSSLFLKSLACFGSAMLAYGLMCPESILLASDLAHFEPPLLMRYLARIGLPLLAYGMA